MAALFALGAAAVFGGADFLGGVAARRVPPTVTALVASASGFVVALPVWWVVGGAASPSVVVLGGLAGLAGVSGLVLLFRAFADGPFQLVSPTSAVASAALPVAVGVAGGERPGLAASIGLAVAVPAVWTLAGGGARWAPSGHGRAIAVALAAGSSFGVFFVLLDLTADASGFAPVVAAKGAAIAGHGALVLVRRRHLPPMPRGVPWLALGSGVLDMGANAMFLAATRSGDLSAVAAIVALYPASNALLAAKVLGERLGTAQLGGLAAAVAAAALLSW